MASSSSSRTQPSEPRFYYCECGEKMFVRTSWTEKNPGRRFVKCPDVKTPFCEPFRFIDVELPDYYKKVIYELRCETKNHLRNQPNQQYASEVSETKMELMKKMEELTVVKSKLKLYDLMFLVLIVVIGMLCMVIAVALKK